LLHGGIKFFVRKDHGTLIVPNLKPKIIIPWLAAVQALWWFIAAIVLIIRSKKNWEEYE